MKVGIYIDRMDLRGGAQRVVSNLCHGWVRRGWEVHLLVVSGGSAAFPVPPEVKRHTLATRHKRRGVLGAWDNWQHVRALGRVVRAEQLESVLAVSAVANVHLAQADLPAHVARVGSEHSYPAHFPLPFYKEWFRRRAYPQLDAMVCPTKEAAEYLAKAYPGARTQGIPNWLTWPLPKGDGLARAAIGRPRRRTFLACGRFDKLKGFSRLIAMFDGLKERLPNWDLVIVGDGEDRELLEAQVAQAKLRDRVFFPGWVADMESAFRSADVFVFPSVSEGFALVLAEAMACGLPCVSYDCKVGPSEIIRDGVDGVLIPVGDEAVFSAAMLRLAEDDSERGIMSSASKEILSRLSEEAIQPLWEKVLSQKR
jgi:glycosyltransferase involved in cell wall biosynthesis